MISFQIDIQIVNVFQFALRLNLQKLHLPEACLNQTVKFTAIFIKVLSL